MSKNEKTTQRQINQNAYKLYLFIVAVLGILGGLSLYYGSTYTSSIITALTTVAGLAVGDAANDTKSAS